MVHKRTRTLAVVPLYHPKNAGIDILQALLSQEGVAIDILFVDNSPGDIGLADSKRLADHLQGLGWRQESGSWRGPGKERQRLFLEARPTNPGPGSAFDRGFQAAAAAGSHAWLLDQDMRPEPNCLAELLKVLEALPRPGAAVPARLNPKTGFNYREFVYRDGRPRPVSRGTTSVPTEVDLAVYSGFLLDARLVASGLIPTEYFIDWDDLVMCLRFREKGHPILFVPTALAIHESGTQRRAFFGRGPPIGTWATFRYYYIARNRIHFLKEVRKTHRASFARVVLGTMLHFAIFIVWSDDRLRKSRNLVRGFRDGLRGVVGKRPDRALGSP